MLFDMFNTIDEGVPDVFLMDPDTNECIGGISEKNLGGNVYTSWGSPDQKSIYLLMEPWSDLVDPESRLAAFPGYMLAQGMHNGQLLAVPTFWVAKVDTESWEVVQEIPYPGVRANWIQFSADGKFMYIDSAGTDAAHKIDLATNEASGALPPRPAPTPWS